jgi:GH25 family lysozyme M1 (1,4-beta-N-acetylmuramidase)
MIKGIDVSDAQGIIPQVQWQAVALDKKFVYNEARIGNDGNSKYFDQNVAGQKTAGLISGAYLYAECLPDNPAHPGRDPESQAQAFFEASNGLGGNPGELPPCIDLEDPDPAHWQFLGITPMFLEDWTGRCIDKVKALFGRAPMVYIYPWWAEEAKLTAAGRCPLWLAVYGGSSWRTVMPWSPTPAVMLQVTNGTGVGAYRLPNGEPCDEDEVADDAAFQDLLK